MKKLPFRHGLAKGSVHIPFDEGAPGGFPVLFCPMLGVVFGFSRLGILKNGQAVLPAQSVGGFPHGPVILAAAVKFFAVHKGHGVDDEMGVEVVFPVQMRCHQHLVSVSPQLSGQLHTDLVGLLRGALPRSERLIAVVGDDALLLPKSLFHRLHFLADGGRGAVDTGD